MGDTIVLTGDELREMKQETRIPDYIIKDALEGRSNNRTPSQKVLERRRALEQKLEGTDKDATLAAYRVLEGEEVIESHDFDLELKMIAVRKLATFFKKDKVHYREPILKNHLSRAPEDRRS